MVEIERIRVQNRVQNQEKVSRKIFKPSVTEICGPNYPHSQHVCASAQISSEKNDYISQKSVEVKTCFLSPYLTPKQFVEKYKFMPMGGLRHLLFHSRQNGLEKAILRMGKRKLLISEEGFFTWLKEQNRIGDV